MTPEIAGQSLSHRQHIANTSPHASDPQLNAIPHLGARKAALMFIFITVLIDVLAFGVIIPVLPHLVQQFVGGDLSTAAYWTGLFSFTFALVQFFSAPIQGALSGKFRAAAGDSCCRAWVWVPISCSMALAPSLA